MGANEKPSKWPYILFVSILLVLSSCNSYDKGTAPVTPEAVRFHCDGIPIDLGDDEFKLTIKPIGKCITVDMEKDQTSIEDDGTEKLSIALPEPEGYVLIIERKSP